MIEATAQAVMIHRRSPDTDPTPLVLRTCEKNSGIHRSCIHGEESEVRGILGEECEVRGKRGKSKPKRGSKAGNQSGRVPNSPTGQVLEAGPDFSVQVDVND